MLEGNTNLTRELELLPLSKTPFTSYARLADLGGMRDFSTCVICLENKEITVDKTCL